MNGEEAVAFLEREQADVALLDVRMPIMDGVAAAGIILPEDMDDETFVTLFGLGSTLSRSGKEMEAIRAANFLTNNDPHGSAWIQYNKPPAAEGEAGGRRGRAGGRRRRA